MSCFDTRFKENSPCYQAIIDASRLEKSGQLCCACVCQRFFIITLLIGILKPKQRSRYVKENHINILKWSHSNKNNRVLCDHTHTQIKHTCTESLASFHSARTLVAIFDPRTYKLSHTAPLPLFSIWLHSVVLNLV